MRISILLALLISVAGLSQDKPPATVHVVSSRVESSDQVSPGSERSVLGAELVYSVYTVKSDSFIYELESADTRQPEVGKDYAVVKMSKSNMTLLIPGKKRSVGIDFHIKSVSEIPK